MTIEQALSLWHRYVLARDQTEVLRYELFTEHRDALPELVRKGLSDPRQMLFALEIGSQLPLEERKGLLPELLAVASYGGAHIVRARELIRAFPSEWLFQNIESNAAPILDRGDAEEYRRLMELYVQLNQELALKLAKRASNHEDADVRAVAHDFSEFHQQSNE